MVIGTQMEPGKSSPHVFGTTAAGLVVLLLAANAYGYPEFQVFAEKSSGRTTDCAMCHVNPSGPVGTGEGQIGALTMDQVKALNKARGAIDPGQAVESPVLNDFGNAIMEKLGRRKVLELKSSPAELAAALGGDSDLDQDGISDGQEFLDGTDPLSRHHGDPWKLFLINLDRYKFYIALTALGIGLVTFGFSRIFASYARLSSDEINQKILD